MTDQKNTPSGRLGAEVESSTGGGVSTRNGNTNGTEKQPVDPPIGWEAVDALTLESLSNRSKERRFSSGLWKDFGGVTYALTSQQKALEQKQKELEQKALDQADLDRDGYQGPDPADKEEKFKSTSDGAALGPTWTDYVEAANQLGYYFQLNDLADTLEVNGERITDVTEAVILSQLHARGLKSVDVARRAFLASSDAYRYHPVKEYLGGLIWDGVDHISTLAGHFADKHDPIIYSDGAQRSVFHAFFRRWLVGAIAKVYDPTSAQNPMLILAGGQGRGKSYFVKWLCPLPALHFEGAIKPEDKDYLSYLTTRWIWEVGELGATIRKADREALKEFITKQDATFRPAYGRHVLVKPALASFIGTVNLDGALLSDPTGHRRFWPVELVKDAESIDWGYAQNIDVHQIWAQARALYRGGESWKLSAEEQAAHAVIVELYEVEDILAGYVEKYLYVEPSNEDLFMTTTDILDSLRAPDVNVVKTSGRAIEMQLASTLSRLGLTRTRKWIATEKAQRWGYVGIGKRKE